MNRKTAFLILALGSSTAANAEPGNKCPAELVNFWKSFAIRTENPDAIPRFLLQNDCFRALGITAFPELTRKRLDQPGRTELVDQMVAQLGWTARQHH